MLFVLGLAAAGGLSAGVIAATPTGTTTGTTTTAPQTIAPGVTIGGVDVGDLTADDAIAEVNAAFAEPLRAGRATRTARRHPEAPRRRRGCPPGGRASSHRAGGNRAQAAGDA